MWTPDKLALENAYLKVLSTRTDKCEWVRTLFRLLQIQTPLPSALRLVHEQLRDELCKVAKECPDLAYVVPLALTDETVSGPAVFRASEDLEMVLPTYLHAQKLHRRRRTSA